MTEEKICGTCKYHHRDEDHPSDYICVNGESEYCADWTEYRDSCDEWEEREN